MTPVIPAPVPVPLPAPAWLLEFLLVFTFILHLLPMNFLLGGVVMVSVSSFLGRNDAKHREFARRAGGALPPVVAFAITLGVAPLLFLQLVYGQFFYASSVLMAWFWLAVVLLVMLGYYGVYWYNMQQEELGRRAADAHHGHHLPPRGVYFFQKPDGHVAATGFLQRVSEG